MKRILAAAFAAVLLSVPALASQKSKAQLTTTINTQLPSTGQGAITASILRQVLQDMVDSSQQIELLNQQTGTTYTFLAADQGKLVTFNNVASVAVTLPQATGDFGAGWNAIVQNIGAGVVTITPAGGTINGSASPLVLNQNQVALIVSGGSSAYRQITYGVMVSVTCGTGLSGGVITTTGTCSITDTISSGTAGSANVVPVITYNSRGQLTAVTTSTISAGSLGALLIVNNLSDVASASVARSNLGVAIGTNVEAWDADLDAIAALSSTGLSARTGSGTWVTRAVTGTAAQIDVTNGDGVAGNPTVSLPNAITLTGKTLTAGTMTGSTIVGATISNSVTAARGTVPYIGSAGLWSALGPCTAGQVLSFGGAGADPTCATVSGTGTVTSIAQGTGLSFSSNPITTTGTASVDLATNANVWAATASKPVDSAVINSALNPVSITQTTGTITIDMGTGTDYQVTLTQTPTFANPTNVQTGRTGCIWITQPSTGSFTVSFGANWKFAGGSAPTLTASASAADVLCYKSRTSSFVWGALNKDIR